jgi:hypothetical protein
LECGVAFGELRVIILHDFTRERGNVSSVVFFLNCMEIIDVTHQSGVARLPQVQHLHGV